MDAGLSPRGVATANALWRAGGGGAPVPVPVQIDFERRLGPLALACRHWRRGVAGRCVRHWRRAAEVQELGAGWAEQAQAQQPLPLPPLPPLAAAGLAQQQRSAAARLRPWWARWRGWHGGRRERREQVAAVWTALRQLHRLRDALAEWRAVAADALVAAAARERGYAAQYWFGRWFLCAENAAAPFVRVEHRRMCSVAAQWLRQARRQAVAARWRAQVARREGAKHLRRRVLRRWYGAAYHADRPQLVAAASHRETALAAQCWSHWAGLANRAALLGRVLGVWHAIAQDARAMSHLVDRRQFFAFRYWVHEWLPAAKEKAAERVRIDVFVLAYSSAREARETKRLMHAMVGTWLRYCNDQLAARTRLAIADQCFLQNQWQRLTSRSFCAWRDWTHTQVCTALCAAAAAKFSSTSLARRCLTRWRHRQVTSVARRRRLLVGKLAVSHSRQSLAEKVFRAWIGWFTAVHRLMQQAFQLAEAHGSRRAVVCSFRRWCRRACRTASLRRELVGLHLRKTRTRRAFFALRKAADGEYDVVATVDGGCTAATTNPPADAAAITSAELLLDPLFSPGGGMHGITPPPGFTPPLGERPSRGYGASPPPSQPQFQSAEKPVVASTAEDEEATTPWAKHVADLMGQFVDDGGCQCQSAERQTDMGFRRLAAAAEQHSPQTADSTYDYLSVSDVSSSSASDEDEPDQEQHEQKAPETGSSGHKLRVWKDTEERKPGFIANPMTTGRLQGGGLRPKDTNAVAAAASGAAPKIKKAKIVRGKLPGNEVLTVAVLGAVEAGAAAWRERRLQRVALQRWLDFTNLEAEAAALHAQAASMATFQRMRMAMARWRIAAFDLPRPPPVKQQQQQQWRRTPAAPASPALRLPVVFQGPVTDKGSSPPTSEEDERPHPSDSPSRWEDHGDVARAIRTLSDPTAADDSIESPAASVTRSPPKKPSGFDVEAAMAAIRASQSSRAEAAALIGGKIPPRKFGELGSPFGLR